jgi:segregation and condensation protein B
MSLKAKLEAVIYAAEEPVTLAQLASLFALDAFEWKAERDAESSLSLEPMPETSGAFEPSDSTRELADLLAVVDSESEPETAGPEVKEPEAADIAAPEVEASGPLTEAEPVATSAEVVDPELEAKRLERKREREVREILRIILDELIAEYASEGRGLEIREIAGGFRMGTKPEIHDAVRIFVRSLKPPMKLSLPALETLAVIAYKQPVTAPEVGEIRGVDSAGVLGSLMSRKLIATAGRKQVIGRPMLYKTTKEFLLRFGLKDLNELPSMEEFEKMAALELSEESVDDESVDSSEPVELSGDLFAEANEDSATSFETDSETEEPGALSQASKEIETEVSTPTAESSEEAAEAHAIVERQNAEEIEVER